MPFDSTPTAFADADSRLRVEGYASLFGVEDLNGDVVHAGAFRDSLRARKSPLPMLLDHSAEVIGEWSLAAEDARGLFVRGFLRPINPRAEKALDLLRRQRIDGLSIGFVAKRSRPRPARGRDLFEIDLWEVSIVASPMAPQARLRIVRGA